MLGSWAWFSNEILALHEVYPASILKVLSVKVVIALDGGGGSAAGS